MCLNNYQCKGSKIQSFRARVHSISDGLILALLFVCVRFNLFLYMLLSIIVPFHWPLLGEVLCSPDNHFLSHLICFLITFGMHVYV